MEFPQEGNEATSGGHEMTDGIKYFLDDSPFKAKTSAPENRRMGWWRDIRRGNGTKKIENHGNKRNCLIVRFFPHNILHKFVNPDQGDVDL